MKASTWTIGRHAALIGLLLSACSFPEITIVQGTTSTSSSTSGGGAGGGTASTTSTGGTGGQGGTGDGGGTCVRGDCSQDIDKDHDGHADRECASGGEGGGGLPYDDCDDCDPDVSPEHTRFESEPHPIVRWDYNCDGRDEHQYSEVQCEGILVLGECTGTGFRRASAVGCGEEEEFGNCMFGLACNFMLLETRSQQCR